MDFNYFKLTTPVTPVLQGRIQKTTAERRLTTPTDEFFVNWDNPAAIVMMISSVVVALITLMVAIFLFANMLHPVVRDTSISFHIVQFSSMFISCFITYIFIGDPPDSTCAFRPWTSLLFTFVYGNVLAKQISVFVQYIASKARKDYEDEGIMRLKYGPILIFRNLIGFLVIHLIILIVWTTVSFPINTLVTGDGPYDTEVHFHLPLHTHSTLHNATLHNSPTIPSPARSRAVVAMMWPSSLYCRPTSG